MSILNVDYKIFAKILATHLEGILPTVISQDQTGFIKDRQLFLKIRRLLNITYMQSANNEHPEMQISLNADNSDDSLPCQSLELALNSSPLFNYCMLSRRHQWKQTTLTPATFRLVALQGRGAPVTAVICAGHWSPCYFAAYGKRIWRYWKGRVRTPSGFICRWFIVVYLVGDTALIKRSLITGD